MINQVSNPAALFSSWVTRENTEIIVPAGNIEEDATSKVLQTVPEIMGACYLDQCHWGPTFSYARS